MRNVQYESHAMTELAKKRPEFRNINALSDLPSYRLPAAGWVSILHRISGAMMFLLLPFIIWMFDTSVSSEISFARFRAAFNTGIGFEVLGDDELALTFGYQSAPQGGDGKSGGTLGMSYGVRFGR